MNLIRQRSRRSKRSERRRREIFVHRLANSRPPRARSLDGSIAGAREGRTRKRANARSSARRASASWGPPCRVRRAREDSAASAPRGFRKLFVDRASDRPHVRHQRPRPSERVDNTPRPAPLRTVASSLARRRGGIVVVATARRTLRTRRRRARSVRTRDRAGSATRVRFIEGARGLSSRRPSE